MIAPLEMARARDLMIDAYGDPGEDYPLDMTYRLDRMPRQPLESYIRTSLANVAYFQDDYPTAISQSADRSPAGM